MHYYCSSLAIVVRFFFPLQEEKIHSLKGNPHVSGPAQSIPMVKGQLYVLREEQRCEGESHQHATLCIPPPGGHTYPWPVLLPFAVLHFLSNLP